MTAPGAGARIARVPLRTRGTTIIMSPLVNALRRHRFTFPVYVDPTFHNNLGGNASSWTQVDSGFPTTSYWKESGDLQLGLCDFSSCNGLGVARDFFALPISSALAGADLDWSHIYMTDVLGRFLHPRGGQPVHDRSNQFGHQLGPPAQL